jgi:hypothetical protein
MRCISDLNLNCGYIALRTAIEPEQMANGLRATVCSLEPQLPLDQVQSLERTVSDSEAPRRFKRRSSPPLPSRHSASTASSRSRPLRMPEMAIRIALGSQRPGILRLVFTSAAKLTVAGCAVGLLGAAAASRLLRSFLFGVSPFGPLVLLLAAVFVLMLALLASWTAR